MLSGQFHSVAIDQILVDPDRQRSDLDDIPDLADSIRRRGGLIHPIVIDRDHRLVAGGRRLAACRSLGHTHIIAQYVDELDPLELHLIELEENIKRKQLPWQDECRAVAKFHEIKRKQHTDWSLADTAKAIGLSIGPTQERVSVAAEMAAGNERVLAAPKFSTAKGIVQRANERREAAALDNIDAIEAMPRPEPEAIPILTADFHEWAKTYTGPKFNFIHCDFPYGIGADKFNQGAAPTHGGYDDDKKVYWRCCDSLLDNLDRLASESCHFMFWFSMHYYDKTRSLFSSRGISFDPFPLIWTKSDGVGILPDPSRGPRRIYETAFFGSLGDRKIVRPKANAFSSQSDRSSHMSIKPEPVLAHFFEMFVDENTIFLDPTCGSGSSVRTAERLGARSVLGLERNDEFAEGARRALRNARSSRVGDGK